MAVSVMYRTGYLNIEDFTKALTCILDNTDLDNVETIILGDFNVDYSAKKIPYVADWMNLHFHSIIHR